MNFEWANELACIEVSFVIQTQFYLLNDPNFLCQVSYMHVNVNFGRLSLEEEQE